MYDHTLHRGRKHFYRCCSQASRTAKKLKCHIKDCFKINGKQIIKLPKKIEYIKFKNCGRKTKSPFMNYVDFESIVVPDDNVKQNPDESYTNKHQNMLLVAMVINQYVLTIDLVSLLNHTQAKMLFNILFGV